MAAHSSVLGLAALATLAALPQAVAAQSNGTATYSVTFDSTWSNSTHPGAYPSSAHYSPLIGAVHSAAADFWSPGDIATPGIEQMAETGGTSSLRSEVNASIAGGDSLSVVNGPGIDSPDMTTITVDLNLDHPLVTVVTMIAPSPDWFVGVDSLSLLQNGRWVDEITVPLFAWDAGTDSGASFFSGDQDTSPQSPIALLTSGPFFATTPLATMRFTRVRATAVFGSGVNEPGTITVIGEPRIGQSLTLRMSDPHGVIPTPAITFLAVSSTLQATIPAAGIGRVLPGLGLGATPGSDGELIVDNPLVRVPGPDYTGAPVDHTLSMPADPALAGMEFYAQGVFFAPSTGRIGLTDAVQVVPSVQ